MAERNGSEILVSEGFDDISQEVFYRFIGGEVEFGESSKDALIREVLEETGERIIIDKLFHISESIFTFEGIPGHEILFTYKGSFVDERIIGQNEFWLTESNGEKIKCIWIDKRIFKSNQLKLVPEDLVGMI